MQAPDRPLAPGDSIKDWDGKVYTVVSIHGDILLVRDQKGKECMMMKPGGK